jgi:formate dehydrogenase major subunit
MATKDNEGEGFMNVSRRDFLKISATAAAVGGGWAYNTASALAYEDDPAYKVTNTTCPYCSASCGQRVVTNVSTGEIVDIYGDFESPMNQGGLCAKGSGSFQLATNKRRIGAWPAPHPVNNVFAAAASDVAYVRTGNGPWSQVALQTAMDDIATKMVSYRGADIAPGTASKAVAFLGCSHMNNEPNYLYRKLIANFGSSNVEHQARI